MGKNGEDLGGLRLGKTEKKNIGPTFIKFITTCSKVPFMILGNNPWSLYNCHFANNRLFKLCQFSF